MKLLASLLTVAALAAPALPAFAQAAAKPDLVKGEASYAAVCAACHGADGNSMIPNQPSLAQQHPEYLAKQLMEFKSGKRVDPVMSGMAAVLTDEDVVNVSAWLAKQKAAENTAKDKDLVAWASVFTVVACKTARSPLALAATAPTAWAFLHSTRACRANMLITRWPSW